VGCALLRPDHHFRRKQALGLVLRGVRPVYDIGDELRPEWQCQVVAIDISRFLRVNHEQMVATFAAGDIGILSKFHVTIST